ncbi:hypothetical protein GOP47_0019075 [Adiantum capillus-veneris]|uniref:Mitochondrial carrier protein n=1 Tax=Adiantum capillus-veneris TaxID=13818 RepID=A0A9D4UFS2_ADICA|nr:hypothetical protein GOP47_0019075 [Adiantum capillus-veneris]
MYLLSPERHEDLRASEHRKLSTTAPFQRAPRILSKGTPAADLCACNGEVSFRWLNAGLVAESVAFEERSSNVASGREPAIGLSMVFVEGASARPSSKSLKGWESIKSGMDYVLGRSIVPSTKHKLSELSHAAGKDVPSSSQKANSLQRYSLKSRNGLDLPLTCKETKCHPDIQHSHLLASAEESKGTPKQFLFFERNAVAGGVSGMCVSLCLHPIDTVKTVIQSQSCGNRSVLRTLLAIVSERGFFGLYRGLGSNLASSAPISAIYTFTYESVKAALLPHLPKEYHAIAHCTAGGCASIATSIVYTPSECVKQRMQVGSLHRNSWLTFLGILKNGGLSVLYSGWVAVLCRNVPQSVIKFYTYEGLKHHALSEKPDGTPLSAYQTLAFGGLAGCTAAIFTTPFDVIKTRLQTQLPGSVLHGKGVLRIFQHIATSEGIGGLYRGLLPRLVIYLSQGALFFATYEFMKRVLELDVPKLTVLACHSKEMDIANTIYTDSQSTLAVARNPDFHARTKHIEDNLADFFIKALCREKFEAFCKALVLLPFVD